MVNMDHLEDNWCSDYYDRSCVEIDLSALEHNFAEIRKAVEADYKSKFKGKVKTIEFYIKPEDKAVYYVINGDFSDKIEL